MSKSIYSSITIALLVLSICALETLNTNAQIQELCQISVLKEADPIDGTPFELQVFNDDVLFLQEIIFDGLLINISFLTFGTTITLTEVVPDDWRLADIVCTDPVNMNVGEFEDGSIDLQCIENPGENSSVLCTLMNTTSCGVEVIKRSELAMDFPFEFNAPGSDIPEFTLQDPSADSLTVSIPPGDTVDITENVPGGWMLDSVECTQAPGMSSSPISNGVAVSCESADLIECTFTNSFVRNVPTLNEWGLIALAGVMGLVGFIVIRRRAVVSQ